MQISIAECLGIKNRGKEEQITIHAGHQRWPSRETIILPFQTPSPKNASNRTPCRISFLNRSLGNQKLGFKISSESASNACLALLPLLLFTLRRSSVCRTCFWWRCPKLRRRYSLRAVSWNWRDGRLWLLLAWLVLRHVVVGRILFPSRFVAAVAVAMADTQQNKQS